MILAMVRWRDSMEYSYGWQPLSEWESDFRPENDRDLEHFTVGWVLYEDEVKIALAQSVQAPPSNADDEPQRKAVGVTAIPKGCILEVTEIPCDLEDVYRGQS